MTKHYTFLFLLVVVAGGLSAQVRQLAIPRTAPRLERAVAPRPFVPLETGAPLLDGPPALQQPSVHYRSNMEEQVGTTTWDAPTYGCPTGRMYRNNSGNPVVNWLYSNQLSGNTDRGTANSERVAGVWSEVTGRIEGATRTGFPAAGRLSDGTEVVVSHTTAFTPYRLRLTRRAPGTTTWTNADMPQPTGIGMLWPQIAVGGPDGKTLHVIAITTPVANTGVKYLNVDGQLLYWRSKDGGNTWDVRGKVIAGLDSTLTTRFGANNYTIDAHENFVAIGVFTSLGWHDMPIFKSSDNGGTWDKLTMLDFPDAIENYNPLPGVSYAPEDLGEPDTLAPNQDAQATLTNDGHGALLIDAGGEVHAWFGRMYVGDADFTDSTSYYYPTTNGIIHWKESYGANRFQIITGALDYDGDGLASVGNTELSAYNSAGPASFPSAGIDANGVIYLTYSATNELYRATGLDGNDKVFRHVFLMASSDDGDNWSDPLELTNVPYLEDFVFPVVECVFPGLPRQVGTDKIWVTYWEDFTPGSSIISNVATQDLTNIMSLEIDPLDLSVGLAPVSKPNFDLRLSPNPAPHFVYLTASFEDDQPIQIEIVDLTGKSVLKQDRGTLLGQTIQLPVQRLTPGTYWVRVVQGEKLGVAKLIKL